MGPTADGEAIAGGAAKPSTAQATATNEAANSLTLRTRSGVRLPLAAPLNVLSAIGCVILSAW
jgi:hypothetical protein